MTSVTDTAENTTTSDPTRERLLAAAAEVFAEKGYDRAGVQEIAHRAGFTTGAIYGRFRGKADLLLAAMEGQSADEFEELFAQKRTDGFEGRVTNVLTTVGSHLVTDEFDNGQALLLEAFVAARRDPEVASMLRRAVECRAAEMTELIEAAKVTGAVDPSLDTLAIVRFCHAVGLGFLLFGAIDLPRPAAEPWEALIDLLVRAVQAPGAAPVPTGFEAPGFAGPAPSGTSGPVDAPAAPAAPGAPGAPETPEQEAVPAAPAAPPQPAYPSTTEVPAAPAVPGEAGRR